MNNEKFIYKLNTCVLECVYKCEIHLSKLILLLNSSYPILKAFSWRYVPVIPGDLTLSKGNSCFGGSKSKASTKDLSQDPVGARGLDPHCGHSSGFLKFPILEIKLAKEISSP